MNIVCATDDNFVQHCSIMLVSLLSNNEDVHIYILTEGLKEQNKTIIEEEVNRLGGDLHFCLVDSSIVEKFPMPDRDDLTHISRATYYRLLLADLLPENVHKVIYLDCDMIVNSDLSDLWNVEFGSNALAAVLQIGSGFEAERLGYPIKYGYFNAGMNVLNIDYFRKNKTSSELVLFLNQNYSRILYHDQDALNSVLYDKTIHLMPQWNMMAFSYVFQLSKRCDHENGKVVNNYKAEKLNVKQYKKKPCIIHYTAKPKPWQEGCIHPLANYYYKYARLTLHYSNIKKPSNFKRYYAIVEHRVFEYLSAIKQRFVRSDKTRY